MITNKMHIFNISLIILVSIGKISAQASSLAGLRACLGQKLANQLVTPTSSYSINPYMQYSWLKTGNRNPQTTPRLPLAIFMVATVSDVAVAVKCAVQNGIPPCPRSGGHSYEVLIKSTFNYLLTRV